MFVIVIVGVDIGIRLHDWCGLDGSSWWLIICVDIIVIVVFIISWLAIVVVIVANWLRVEELVILLWWWLLLWEYVVGWVLLYVVCILVLMGILICSGIAMHVVLVDGWGQSFFHIHWWWSVAINILVIHLFLSCISISICNCVGIRICSFNTYILMIDSIHLLSLYIFLEPSHCNSFAHLLLGTFC